MNIGICSLSDREEVYGKTWPLLESYCETHGYKCLLYNRDSQYPEDIASSWLKLKVLQEQHELDYLVWVDDDVIITSDKPVDNFIVQLSESGKMFGISKCSCTAGQANRFIFNMGVMYVKCCLESVNVLNSIWEGGINSRWKNKKLWEQDYITHLYKKDQQFASLFYLYDYGTIQTYVRPYGLPEEFAWKSGDFAAHITGHAANKHVKSRRIQNFIDANV